MAGGVAFVAWPTPLLKLPSTEQQSSRPSAQRGRAVKCGRHTSQGRAVAAAIGALPGTLRYVADGYTLGTGPGQRPAVTVSGLPDLVVEAYDGDSAWVGWPWSAATGTTPTARWTPTPPSSRPALRPFSGSSPVSGGPAEAAPNQPSERT